MKLCFSIYIQLKLCTYVCIIPCVTLMCVLCVRMCAHMRTRVCVCVCVGSVTVLIGQWSRSNHISVSTCVQF